MTIEKQVRNSKVILLLILTTIQVYSFPQCTVNAGEGSSIFCGGSVQLHAERSWEEMDVVGWKYFTSSFFTTAETGYIVTSNQSTEQSYILKTINGGEEWAAVDSFENSNLRSIFFTSESSGYAVGFFILHTNDGGVTWAMQNPGVSVSLLDVYFTSQDTGYAVGEFGIILKTVDGGQNWVQQNSGVQTYLSSVFFIDENNGYAVGEGGVVLKTTDGGNVWTIQNSGVVFHLSSVWFTDLYTGYICAFDFTSSEGIVLKTSDAGDHWTSVNTGASHPLYSICFTDANTGYSVGYAGTIVKTSNAGADWTIQVPDSYREYSTVVFPDANTGYAVGIEYSTWNGALAKLTLSGNSFTWVPTEGLSASNIPDPVANPGISTKYTVTMTTPENCNATDSVEILVTPMNSPDICIVGVNGLNKNMITWDTPAIAAIDSFYLFRESTATGIYQNIGSISASEPGVFIDTASHPEIQSNKYCLSVSDTCGFLSEQGTPHKTMHLAINKGQDSTWNLIWEPYEGFEVSTYYIYRGTSPVNLQLIGSTSGSSTQYSDFTAPAGYVYYQIEVINPNPCGYDKNPLPTSRSNIATNNPLGTADAPASEVNFKIIPNPATDYVLVEIRGYYASRETVLELLNISGVVVRRVVTVGPLISIGLSDLPRGAYLLRVLQTDAVGFSRLIKF
jgi:photosystem II stability/assembly factor-like uncharacterized protein